MPKIVSKSVQTKIFEIKKNFKIPNMPKIVPKSVQTCFEVVLGWFFRKNFLPSVPWRVESSKIFKKIKKVSKFQKCPKSSPKVSKRKFSKSKKISIFQTCPKTFPQVSKRVLKLFYGDSFEKTFCPVLHGGSSLRKFSKKSKKFQNSKNAQNRPQKCPNENFQNQKNFQNSKHAQNRSQKCPNVFWNCFMVILSRKFFAQCSMEGRVFENFQKNQKSFKILKMPKIVPKKSKQKFSKSKNFSKFQKSPKSFPKLSKRVLNMFWGDFFEKIFCPVFHGGSSLRKFSKKIKKLSKIQTCPKSIPKVSKRVLKMF